VNQNGIPKLVAQPPGPDHGQGREAQNSPPEIIHVSVDVRADVQAIADFELSGSTGSSDRPPESAGNFENPPDEDEVSFDPRGRKEADGTSASLVASAVSLCRCGMARNGGDDDDVSDVNDDASAALPMSGSFCSTFSYQVPISWRLHFVRKVLPM
jgi:hypothetical protein